MTARSPRPRALVAMIALLYGLGAIAAGGGGMAFAPLIGLAALIMIPWRALPRLIPQGGVALALSAAAIMWLALSLAWSPSEGATDRFTRLMLTLTAGLIAFVGVQAAAPSRAASRFAAGCVALLAVLLAIEALFDMPLNRLALPDETTWKVMRNPGKGAAIFALFVWGAAVAAFSKPARANAAAVVGGGCAVAFGLAFDMSAAALAALIGLAVWFVAAAAPRWTLRAVGAAIAAMIALAPLIAGQLDVAPLAAAPASWLDRVSIWQAVATYIEAKPFIGYGFDASRTFTTPGLIDGESVRTIPLHPHNLGLQIWLEAGGVGAALAIAALMAIVARAASRGHRLQLRAAAAWLASWAIFATFSFGAWQEWWIGAAAAGAVLIALAQPALDETAI